MEQQIRKNDWTWVYTVLLITLIILAFYSGMRCSSGSIDKSSIEFANALNDTLRTYRNKDSVQTATILSLRTEKVVSLSDLKTMDLELLRLKEVVKEYEHKLAPGSSVTNVSSVTSVKGKQPTVVTVHDTIKLSMDSLYQVYPTYRSELKDKWLDVSVISQPDTTFYDIKITNEYSVILGKDKRGHFADVTNYNPYTSVTKLRSYQVKMPPRKNFSIGIGVGYGLDKSLKPTPYIGIGVHYNIINF